jgi:hypothetical protein
MRFKSTILLVALALAYQSNAAAWDCSCDSGTCSASVSCPGACYAICPKRGGCVAGCFDNLSASSREDGLGKKMKIDSSRANTLVSLQSDGLTPAAISQVMGKALGRPVTFEPFADVAPIAIDVKGLPAARVMELLSQLGVVAVGEERAAGVSERARATDELRVSFAAKELGSDQLAEALSRALREDVTVALGDLEQRISLEVHDVPVEFVLQLLARYGEVTRGGVAIAPAEEQQK